MNEKGKEMLNSLFKISTKMKFNVKIKNSTNPIYTEKIMNYVELGIFLTSKHTIIKCVEIYTID